MSLAQAHDRLQLPDSLRDQLLDFRRRVWTIKLAEAVSAAIFGLLVSLLLMFAIDRVWDTPAWGRLALFVLAWVGVALLPLAIHRWVWSNRRLDQLARLLSRGQPQIGDQLLGVIELSRDESEQARSRALCEAAIRQVAEDALHRDFRRAVPTPRHRLWAWLVAVPALAAVALFTFFPAAATSAAARLFAPWKHTPRYTFAAVSPLPGTLMVAHGEPFSITAALESSTVWRPGDGVARIGDQPPITARLDDGKYEFELSSQIDPGWLEVKIGDSVQRVRVEPTLRPELTSVVAEVSLPEYLRRPRPFQKDVRGGVASLVKGSAASFTASASRDLSSALVDGQDRRPRGYARFESGDQG